MENLYEKPLAFVESFWVFSSSYCEAKMANTVFSSLSAKRR